jgi:hypothetical protein
MRPWADVGIFYALRRVSVRRGVTAELLRASGLSAGTLVTGVALKIRGVRGASGSVEGGGDATGMVGASAGGACRFGPKSASAACRAVWTFWRSGTRFVCCLLYSNVILRVGLGSLNIWGPQRYSYSRTTGPKMQRPTMMRAGRRHQRAVAWTAVKPLISAS